MQVDILILGAGAAGMMCAAQCGPPAGGQATETAHGGAGERRILVVDHARAAGDKIRISGGGRCNFTNLHCAPGNFLSQNPHFCKSALSRYTQWDFLDLVGRHGIAWHEKTLGQLFCDTSAKEIIAMLKAEMSAAGAALWLETEIGAVAKTDTGYRVALTRNGRNVTVYTRALVVATGGKSIPKMGATGLAYRIAAQFGLAVTETRPALVPLTFGGAQLDRLTPLAGLSADATVTCNDTRFREGLLFTHRGLSGPSILQISSYWREGDSLSVALLEPDALLNALRHKRGQHGRIALTTALSEHLPARLAALMVTESGLTGNLADQSDAALEQLTAQVADWSLTPTGSEGYRTAEVTLGGIDTDGLSSKTMESKSHPGLYFIGECVDVTGWLGGFNFQWAWSSGWAAAQAIAAQHSGKAQRK